MSRAWRRQVSLGCWRVLVVEDDDSFAEALRELLEADGRLEVAGRARDGREGVELAESLRPDVVLMDIVLPVMDGVEATREIRRKQPTIPSSGSPAPSMRSARSRCETRAQSISSARVGWAQTSSKSLSLRRITGAVVGAAV
jgi:CheY-like chemotaxis protein